MTNRPKITRFPFTYQTGSGFGFRFRMLDSRIRLPDSSFHSLGDVSAHLQLLRRRGAANGSIDQFD